MSHSVYASGETNHEFVGGSHLRRGQARRSCSVFDVNYEYQKVSEITRVLMGQRGFRGCNQPRECDPRGALRKFELDSVDICGGKGQINGNLINPDKRKIKGASS